MLQSLEAIQLFRSEHIIEAEQQPWLKLLVEAEQVNINLERIHSIAELEETNLVLDYVERTLEVLDRLEVSFWVREIVEEVLAWSEIAKAGSMNQRRAWQRAGINLFVHNIGSAQLYDLYHSKGHNTNHHTTRYKIIRTLIATHGLVGQYIRGEIPFAENAPLHAFITKGWLSENELHTILMTLNECIIAGVSSELWQQVGSEVQEIIGWIVTEPDHPDWVMKERLSRLRSASIRKGEDVYSAYQAIQAEWDIEQALSPLEHRTLWYVESSLQDFSLQEMIKVLLLTIHRVPTQSLVPNGTAATNERPASLVQHISFEPLMNSMYYDYKGLKKLNVYKKRMIEKYLEQWSWAQIESDQEIIYPHLTHRVEHNPELPDTVFVNFEFSPAAEKLIAFCIEAEKSPLYDKAVLLLFDLFGLRRDAYDRFHNEETYLADMNSSGDYKKVLLDYMVGKRVLDIGPGGGVLLDLIEQEKPELEPIGIDISTNVIEALERKKQLEGHRWQVMKGDALQLHQYVQPGTVDTVIFSSILHELYSYIEQNGRKFNQDTVIAALQSSFNVLSPGGRILIRDGIMSEPVDQMRRIRFLEPDGIHWLERYTQDFQGRKITYEALSEDEVLLPINDAMEFLYTYTWGEEAYVHEIQEQFGVFTPSAYEQCIREALGDEAQIITLQHFLQQGYTEALSGRIEFMDEQGRETSLPDSTCLIVIEKRRD